MYNDYKNFVDRMGSFEDTLVLDEKLKNKKIVIKNIDSLSHHGIMGMKWHHHVNANVVGRAAKTGQDLATLGQTVNKGGFNKKTLKEAKNLSDEDLKNLTNRLNLENNYINAKQQQSGRGKVDRILSTAGSTLAVASSAAVLYQTIKKVT